VAENPFKGWVGSDPAFFLPFTTLLFIKKLAGNLGRTMIVSKGKQIGRREEKAK